MVLQHVLHDGGRKAERRLVEHHEVGLAHQAAADGEHLLLAAGQRAGRLALALRKLRKQREHAIEILRLVGARPRQHRAHLQVLQHGQRRKHLAALRHLADAEIADPVRRQAGDARRRAA